MLKIFLHSIFLLIIIKSDAQFRSVAIISNSERDLIPEGIAVDYKTGSIYVSSIAKQKIIKIDAQGKCKDFISTNEHGFLEGLGMKVDAKRNLLWAISVTTAPKLYVSQVHAFNLASGKQEQFYSLKDTVPHMFNDLDIDKKGNLYITDSYASAIYFIDTDKKKLALFLKIPETKYPNGIAIGKKDQLYFTSYEHGPVKIDIASKTATILKGHMDSTVARGLDGLLYSDNSLIGIYNYSATNNSFDTAVVVKYLLDEKGTTIIKEEIIDKGNPKFFQPTTAALANKQLFVLANSHLEVYNANKQSTKGKEDQLKPVTILSYKLQ